MTFATAVHILFTSFVYPPNVYLSVIHGIKRKPHLSVVWNWYHFVAIANLHQPRPTDSADINTRLQLSDTSSIPPMHGGFLLNLSKLEHLLITMAMHIQYKQVSVIDKEWFGSLSPDNKVGVANIGPTWVLSAPWWAPWWPHEPCYQGGIVMPYGIKNMGQYWLLHQALTWTNVDFSLCRHSPESNFTASAPATF